LGAKCKALELRCANDYVYDDDVGVGDTEIIMIVSSGLIYDGIYASTRTDLVPQPSDRIQIHFETRFIERVELEAVGELSKAVGQNAC